MEFIADSSEHIIDYKKKWAICTIVGTILLEAITQLYRTEKGEWFSIVRGDLNQYLVEKEKEENVKNILIRSGRGEVLNKYFATDKL
jgi:hypothetical protein